MHKIVAITLCALSAAMAAAPDQTAIAEVAAGKRTTANAAWWGFNQEDSTEALASRHQFRRQDSHRPVHGRTVDRAARCNCAASRRSFFEPGVLILAKKGEFQGAATACSPPSASPNLVIRGYGATLRMHKRDYQNPPYKRREWRMGIAHPRLPPRADRRRCGSRAPAATASTWMAAAPQMERGHHHPQLRRLR